MKRFLWRLEADKLILLKSDKHEPMVSVDILRVVSAQEFHRLKNMRAQIMTGRRTIRAMSSWRMSVLYYWDGRRRDLTVPQAVNTQPIEQALQTTLMAVKQGRLK